MTIWEFAMHIWGDNDVEDHCYNELNKRQFDEGFTAHMVSPEDGCPFVFLWFNSDAPQAHIKLRAEIRDKALKAETGIQGSSPATPYA